MFCMRSLLLACPCISSIGGKSEWYWAAQSEHEWPLAAENTGQRLRSAVFFLLNFICLSMFFVQLKNTENLLFYAHRDSPTEKLLNTAVFYQLLPFKGNSLLCFQQKTHSGRLMPKTDLRILGPSSCWLFPWSNFSFQVQRPVTEAWRFSPPASHHPFLNKPSSSNKTFWAECSTR